MNTSYGITTKYQVTIPKEIREKIGLKQKDRLQFVAKNGQVYIKRAETIEELADELHRDFVKSGVKPATQKDIDQAREKFIKENMKW